MTATCVRSTWRFDCCKPLKTGLVTIRGFLVFLPVVNMSRPGSSSSVSSVESESPQPPSESRSRLVWDMAMDLIFLRQVRGTGNPFVRSSSTLDEVVLALTTHDNRFAGLKKKGASDRLNMLMTKHLQRDGKSRAASGASEDYQELGQLPTELSELKKEKRRGLCWHRCCCCHGEGDCGAYAG